MVGSTLGHYRILHAVGAGGMGEVYAAEDTRLRRRVALKVLPHDVAADEDRLRRFRREAEAVAALSHPNVVTIHSVEEVGGVHFLTMELVEGRTLGAAIPPTGLPLGEFLKLAIPLVDAIAAAHQRGIVHRDLKPGNVMVAADGRVKVLDFGLAKREPDRASGGSTTTMLGPATAPRQVMGTTAYMSPEQAQGGAVDARSDIFSLGIVLYEMATGLRPFTGASELAVLSSILKDSPPALASVRPELPQELGRILRKCLAKEPERRYQAALDLRIDLEELGAPSSAIDASLGRPRRTRVGRTALRLSAVGAMAAALLAAWRYWPASAPGAALHPTFTQLTFLPGAELYSSLSPDGQWVIYGGEGEGHRDIFLQSVSGQTAIDLTGDSPADDDQPAFSADGERIAFRSSREGGGIFVMGRTGEGVRRVTRSGHNPAWSPDGAWLAYTSLRMELRPRNSEGDSDLWVVPVDGGGEPRRVFDGEAALPRWSPDGSRIAFAQVLGREDRRTDIVTVAAAGGAPVPLLSDEPLDWNPVWAPDGRHLYFVSDRGGSMNLWRVPIEQASGRALGPPEPITSPAPFAAHLSVSGDGRRLSFSSVIETQNLQALALDPGTGRAAGAPRDVTSGSRFWSSPDPSPDGRLVAAYSQVQPEGDLYVFRADGVGAPRQLTSGAALDRLPRWSPDGGWILMFSDRSGTLESWKVRADGSDLTQLSRGGGTYGAWSPDGRRIVVSVLERLASVPSTAFIASADGTGEAEWLPPAPAPHDRFHPNSWSPDGRRLVGPNGVGVPGISVYDIASRTYERVAEFGEWPVWLPDSRRVLFVSRGREFHVLDTATKAVTLAFSVPRDTLGPPRVTADGRRAYFSRRVTEADVWLMSLQER